MRRVRMGGQKKATVALDSTQERDRWWSHECGEVEGQMENWPATTTTCSRADIPDLGT